MKKAIWMFVLCVALPLCGRLCAQDIPVSFDDIVRSDKIDTLLCRQSLVRGKNPAAGYRVLIFSQGGNNSKDAALAEKERFEEAFPESKVYVSFEEPYFKVKAGNFIDRMQADFFLREIKILYPYAFIVKDALNVADYLGLGDGKDNAEDQVGMEGEGVEGASEAVEDSEADGAGSGEDVEDGEAGDNEEAAPSEN